MKIRVSDFMILQKNELRKSRVKHADINSLHEGYGVLLEEVEEFWELVKTDCPRLTRDEMAIELAQIACVCQRIFEEVIL